MKRLMFLPLVGAFLLATGVAMGQAWTPSSTVPGDDPRYLDAGKTEQGGVTLIRVDKETGMLMNVSYLTKGKTLPYFMAPSLITHPNWKPDKAEQHGNAEHFISEWTVTITNSAVPTSPGTVVEAPSHGKAGNVYQFTGKELGASKIMVKEVPILPAYKACESDIKESEFEIMVTGEPGIGVKKATLTSTSGETEDLASAKGLYGYKTTVAGVALEADTEVWLVQSCKDIEGTLNLHFGANEENVEAPELMRYAFAFTLYEGGSVDELGAGVAGVVGDSEEYDIRGSAPNYDFTGLSDFSVPYEFAVDLASPKGTDNKANETILLLTTPTNLADAAHNYDPDKPGMASLVSLRSDNHRLAGESYTAEVAKDDGAGSITTEKQELTFAGHPNMFTIYPYEDAVRAIVIRATHAPNTGPIYHIPNTL